MAKIPCPIPGYDEMGEDGPRYYVTVPDEWLGEHARAYWDSSESLRQAGIKHAPFIERFIHSLALADDYQLPGLTGKPENWDFEKMPLEVMAWAVFHLYTSYNGCFTVKKNWLMPSLNGSKPTGKDQAPGILESILLEPAL